MIRSRTRSRAGAGGGPWYTSSSYLLNSVAPSMIHDYANNRYWNSAAGSTSFPFTSTRASNATMFDSSGNLVWAPANLIARSGVAGAVVGVIGSGGALPTGWSWASPGAAALTREVVAVGPDYIDVRCYGSNTSGAAVYPSIFLSATPLTAVIGQPICFSMYTQLIAGSFAGVTYGPCGALSVQFQNGGSYVSNTSVTARATSTYTRYASTGSRATADHNQWMPYFIIGLNNNDTCDFTVRLSSPQLEYQGPDSPKAYNATNGSAYYGPRIGKDPHTGRMGLLVESSKTNICPISNVTNGPNGLSEGAGGTELGWASRRLTGNGAFSGHFCPFTAVTPAASTVHTISALVKMVSGTRIQLTGSSSWSAATDYVNFNLSNGTVVGTGGTILASSITACGSGWYRIAITFTTTASPTSGSCGLLALITSDSDTRIPANSSTDVFDFSGIQMEAGHGATSYIPTYYATATRSSDTLNTTSISWLNQALGTWYAQFTPFNDHDSARRVMSIGDGTANNGLSITHTTSKFTQLRTNVAGTPDFTPTTSTTAEPFVAAKFGAKLSSPNKRISLNGATVVGASVAFPTSGYTTFRVGAETDGSISYLGYIHEIRYYPSSSASDGQLQTLTT